MSNDKETFERRCNELRDAAAAVDVFQRSSPKGGFETVTVHVHTNDDEDCIAAFEFPIGAINSTLQTALAGVRTAERLVSLIETLGGEAVGDGRIHNDGGYRDGGVA